MPASAGLRTKAEHLDAKAYILGGFGGAAGIDICQKLFAAGRNVHGGNDLTADSGDIHFVLDSHPGKEGHVTTEGCIAPLRAGLDRAAAHRNVLGEDTPVIVAIGCNTMHTALPHVDIPDGLHVVHIMDATANAVKDLLARRADPPPKILLWSTTATAQSGLYQQHTRRVAGVSLENPPAAHAEAFERMIELTKIGRVQEAVSMARKILREYEEGTVVVLGCTELPLVVAHMDHTDLSGIDFVDCNDALARETVFEYAVALGQQEQHACYA